FGLVIGVSFLLLVAVFRSLLIPLKAALMNLLSIGAAYGFVVAVFQWGWGMRFVGVDQSAPVESFLPMMLFAVLFGLSMDYEVFVVSRIREEYLASRDNAKSVARGLAATASVITGGGSDHDHGVSELCDERSARREGVRARARDRRVGRCDGRATAA